MCRSDLDHIEKKVMLHQAQILGQEEYSSHAVLIPLIEMEDRLHILFEVRSENLRRQPGEICFPGGRIDKGDSGAPHAAIRETSEELGIAEDHIEMIGSLDYLITPFQLIVYPFVGKLTIDPAHIQPNPDEVGEVFYVPLDFLLHATPELYHVHLNTEPEKGFPFDLIPHGKNYTWRRGKIPEYFYVYQEYIIWGMTARILHHFLQIIKEE